MRRWLLKLLLPPRGHIARVVEGALVEDRLRLSRRERKILTARVCDALEQFGICPK